MALEVALKFTDAFGGADGLLVLLPAAGYEVEVPKDQRVAF
jgi:hypothetical protein